MRLLERRMRPDSPSPRNLFQGGSFGGQDVSEEGFPVSCLPIGASPLRTTTTASDDSEVAEASRGAFSILSRQDFPLKRKLSDAMGVPPLPDPTRQHRRSVSPAAPSMPPNRARRPPLSEAAAASDASPGAFKALGRTTPLSTAKGSAAQQQQHQQRNTMTKYFPVLQDFTGSRGSEQLQSGQPSRDRNEASCMPRMAQAACQTDADESAGALAKAQALQAELDRLREEADQLRSDRDGITERLKAAQDRSADLHSQVASMQQQLEKRSTAAAKREAESRRHLQRLAEAAARRERDNALLRVQDDGIRLGSLSVMRAGPIGLREVWEEGRAFVDLAVRQSAVAEARAAIEMARKAMRKKLPPPENTLSQPGPSQHNGQDFLSPEDYVEQDEIFKARVAALKREEDSLNKDRERLEAEKARHIRELKRLKEEEGSRFRDNPILARRYMLLRLLGKGGFSEVFQAFDLDELREVAVKIHQLNSTWNEGKKASYVRHALREYNIHRGLAHPRIVALLDIFEIDTNTFATVLELCTGGDLDTHLKEHQVLPEKEARVITAQVVQGLAYLNEAPRHIIHYDLKPANILFDSFGQAKITDFGLSKIVEEGQSRGMELTSQGAGTYWYLPPECFLLGSTPPVITNKVDVWAVGVMLYQMVFGKRPFGEGCSQEEILRNDIMLNARQVTFPSKPAVSAECKEFISRCLTYRQEDRLDVMAAAAQPYLVMKRSRQGSAAAPAASPAPAQKPA
ncbi:g10982 [Coccomyxa elongata]